MTSEFLLRRCYAVQPGDPILVNAAAGGVGALMSQGARRAGCLRQRFRPAAGDRAGAAPARRLALSDPTDLVRTISPTTEELAASAQALFHMIEAGAVKIEIGQRFPLREARRAREALEDRRTTGATVLIP